MKVTDVVYSGKVISVVRTYEPEKPSAYFEAVRHPGSAAVVAMTNEGRLLLVNQYREAIGEYVLEIPAGKLEAGEAPETCASRELEEETGYRARSLEKLCEFFVTPGYSDEKIRIFSALGLESSKSNLDEDEVLSPVEVGLADAFAMIDDGRIEDAKTIAGILQFARKKKWFLSLKGAGKR
jgi:ADP-ribose pyrophosphatase